MNGDGSLDLVGYDGGTLLVLAKLRRWHVRRLPVVGGDWHSTRKQKPRPYKGCPDMASSLGSAENGAPARSAVSSGRAEHHDEVEDAAVQGRSRMLRSQRGHGAPSALSLQNHLRGA